MVSEFTAQKRPGNLLWLYRVSDAHQQLSPHTVYPFHPENRSPNELFDVIMIDVDHSPDERLGDESVSFYTSDGLIAARQHMAEDGVLAVWSYAQSSPFVDALRSVFKQVRVEPVTYDNQLIDQQQTDWLFFASG